MIASLVDIAIPILLEEDGFICFEDASKEGDEDAHYLVEAYARDVLHLLLDESVLGENVSLLQWQEDLLNRLQKPRRRRINGNYVQLSSPSQDRNQLLTGLVNLKGHMGDNERRLIRLLHHLDFQVLPLVHLQHLEDLGLTIYEADHEQLQWLMVPACLNQRYLGLMLQPSSRVTCVTLSWPFIVLVQLCDPQSVAFIVTIVDGATQWALKIGISVLIQINFVLQVLVVKQ